MSYTKHPLTMLAYVGIAIVLVAIFLPWVAMPQEVAALVGGEVNAELQKMALVVAVAALIGFVFLFFGAKKSNKVMLVLALIFGAIAAFITTRQYVPDAAAMGYYLALIGSIAIAVSGAGGLAVFKK